MKKLIHKNLHQRLITLLYEAHASHIGSSLSCLDILIELMIYKMREGDKFMLSKGHAVPALYIVLNYMGKISNAELSTFHKNGTRFPAHPPPHLGESVPFPSGSLGHGLSVSAGIAQAMRYLNKGKRKRLNNVFCLLSDGECNEGQVWEAAQYVVAKKLNNLVVMVDNNRLQAFGKTKDVLGESTSPAKWKAFGFDTYECNGHNPKDIKKILSIVTQSKKDKPKAIIFNTIKGYGVDFMENKIEWHYNLLDEDLYKKALLSIDRRIKD